jgi:hypothetical protein
MAGVTAAGTMAGVTAAGTMAGVTAAGTMAGVTAAGSGQLNIKNWNRSIFHPFSLYTTNAGTSQQLLELQHNFLTPLPELSNILNGLSQGEQYFSILLHLYLMPGY